MTPNKFISTISVIHLGLLSGIIAFGTVIYFENDDWIINYTETENIFFFIVPIMSVCGILIGNILFDAQIKRLAPKNSLSEKLIGFQTASIIRYALIEAPALLGIISSMLSGNLFYLLISSLLAAYFYSLKPTKDKIEQSLNFSPELKRQFDRSDQIIQ